MKSKSTTQQVAVSRNSEAISPRLCNKNGEHSETWREKQRQTLRLASPEEELLFFCVPVSLGNSVPLKATVPSLMSNCRLRTRSVVFATEGAFALLC